MYKNTKGLEIQRLLTEKRIQFQILGIHHSFSNQSHLIEGFTVYQNRGKISTGLQV